MTIRVAMRPRPRMKPKAKSGSHGVGCNVLRYDPTRAGLLRNKFRKFIHNRFSRFRIAVINYLMGAATRERWRGLTLSQRGDEFKAWVENQARVDLLGTGQPLIINTFCPTGEGGGVDPGCSPVSSLHASGKFTEEETSKALTKLSSLPAAEEGYQHFDTVDEVRMTEFGMKQPTEKGMRLLPVPADDTKDAGKYRVMTLDPSKVHYTQSSVTRKGVEEKLTIGFDNPRYATRGLPGIVKDTDGSLHLQGGHHRAASQILATGKITGRVIEIERRLKGGRGVKFKVPSENLTTNSERSGIYASFTHQAYLKGANRAYDEVNRRAISVNFLTHNQNRHIFINNILLNRSKVRDNVKLLTNQAADRFEAIANAAASKSAIEVIQGLGDGKTMEQITRALMKSLEIDEARAKTTARTEITRSHAEGELDALEELNVDEVVGMAEWNTSGGPKVCDLCEPLEGIILTVAEARGMLPRHPNCECAWLPHMEEDERREGQKFSKYKIEKALAESWENEGEEEGEDDDGEDEGWGPGKAIGRNRPLSNAEWRQSLLDFSQQLRAGVFNAFCPTGPGGPANALP